MEKWYKIKEQSAGYIRLELLWLIYKIVHLRGIKFFLHFIVPFIALFADKARKASKSYRKVLYEYLISYNLKVKKFSSYRHILSYAFSLADKINAICNNGKGLKFNVCEDENWQEFQKCIQRKEGAFLISSHLGNVEAFCGYKDNSFKQTVHALMDIEQSSVFHSFVESKAVNSAFKLYSSKELRLETIMELYENLCDGDILLMAGDRVSKSNPNNIINAKMLNKECVFPRGAFEFAKKMRHKTFAILVLSDGIDSYKIKLKGISFENGLKNAVDTYAKFIEENLLENPTSWYNFYDYFM